jgi:hypothetical protein
LLCCPWAFIMLRSAALCAVVLPMGRLFLRICPVLGTEAPPEMVSSGSIIGLQGPPLQSFCVLYLVSHTPSLLVHPGFFMCCASEPQRCLLVSLVCELCQQRRRRHTRRTSYR